MITDVENCSADELQRQIAYLCKTPVRKIAKCLWGRQCTLKKGIVRSLKALGNLKTEFGKIGSSFPKGTDGEQKFRVSEVMPLLRSKRECDAQLQNKIEAFIAKDGRGEVEYNVTVFCSGNDPIIKDGNKRTIAFYERRKELSNDVIEFRVYVVQPATQ